MDERWWMAAPLVEEDWDEYLSPEPLTDEYDDKDSGVTVVDGAEVE